MIPKNINVLLNLQRFFDAIFPHINGEREIPGRRKVVRESNVPVSTSHVGLNLRSKSGYEREARVINNVSKKITTKRRLNYGYVRYTKR